MGELFSLVEVQRFKERPLPTPPSLHDRIINWPTGVYVLQVFPGLLRVFCIPEVRFLQCFLGYKPDWMSSTCDEISVLGVRRDIVDTPNPFIGVERVRVEGVHRLPLVGVAWPDAPLICSSTFQGPGERRMSDLKPSPVERGRFFLCNFRIRGYGVLQWNKILSRCNFHTTVNYN